MATLEQLSTALKNADAAGDTDAAKMLANEIIKMRQADAPESAESEVLRKELSALLNIRENPHVRDQVAETRRSKFDELPTWAKPIVATQDTARLLADGMTFGADKKLAAAIRAPFTDKSYSEELAGMRDQLGESSDRAGNASIPTQLTGNVMTGSLLAKNGVTLAGRLGTAAMDGAKGLAARAGLMGVEGAAYGTADALGHDTDVATGAAAGLVGGVGGSLAGDAISAGLTKVSGLLKGSPKVPDLSKLKDAAKAAYKEADDAGVIIKPEGMKRLADTIKSDLVDAGYHPKIQPQISAVLEELDNAANGNITLKGLDVIRRIADNARKSQNPSEKMLGNQLISRIDEFVSNMKPSDILAGNASKGVAALQKGRSLWTRISKNERLISAIDKAENRAASTGAGANAENAMRQNLRRELETGRGYTPDEKLALKDIVRGTTGQNALRLAGKMAPTGIVSGGMGTTIGATIGGLIGGPGGAMVGAAGVPAVGQVAKMMADKGVRDGVQALQILVRGGGDSAALQAAQGALAKLTQSQRNTINMLVRSGVINLNRGNEQPRQQQ